MKSIEEIKTELEFKFKFTKHKIQVRICEEFISFSTGSNRLLLTINNNFTIQCDNDLLIKEDLRDLGFNTPKVLVRWLACPLFLTDEEKLEYILEYFS